MESDSRGPIRIGLVGLGRAGLCMHVPELAKFPELFRIVAACDPIKERRDDAEARTGCRTYRRYEDLLADMDVELVDIATRSDDHFDHALAALKSRRWVLLEKPMTLNYEEALKLRAASIKAGNKLYVRHNRRFEPGFTRAREAVASGVLGEVYDVRLRRGAFQRRDDWQTVRRCGGGQLLNWGPHLIDQALQFLGTPPVQMWSELKRVAALGDAEDYARVILRNSDGLTVDLEISGGRIVPEPEIVVTGTRGALTMTGDTIKLRYLDPARKLARRRASVRTPPLGGFGSPENLVWIEKQVDVVPTATASMDATWPHLHAAIRRNKPFPVTLDQAVEVMRVITAARKDTPFG
ncbi:MAG: Gfo/Idh/MocA family oxidoreductase [Kiritimatiellae bacterium]|nr:Gfo/Idh/MocA family oxidoreductase [Kiritimatiellia bacterium]